MKEAGMFGYLKAKEKLKLIAKHKIEKLKSDYESNPKLCKNCCLKIEFKKRYNQFCNRSCSAIFNNKKYIKRIRQKLIVCSSCNNKPTKYTYGKFCKDCILQGKHHLVNVRNTLDVCKTDSTRRKFLIKKSGRFCWICKNNKWNNEDIPLELDHIDGNHNNNLEQNLQVICPNCHALTPTYKNKNKGNGRVKRRKDSSTR